MAKVDAAKTPLSQPQALSVLLEALGPDRAALPMVAAQSAVETAHWNGMWRWNFGNITTRDPSKDFQILPSDPPNPLHFLVYESPQDGARDYVEFLRKRGIIDYALRGDLPGYVAHLKATGYLGFVGRPKPNGTLVTDAEYDVYGRNIASLIRTFQNMVPEPLRGVASASFGSTKRRETALIVSVLAGAAYLLLYGRKKA